MQSRVAKGAPHGVRLIKGPPQTAPTIEQGRSLHPSSRVDGGGPILYISGDRESRIRFARIARRWTGIKLLVVEGGRMGLEMASDRRLGLVVLDEDLSDMNAEALVRHVRQEGLLGLAPIIVLGDSGRATAARFLWAGASVYLAKPLNTVEVDRAVVNLMEVASLR